MTETRRESVVKARGGFLPVTRGGYLTTGKPVQDQRKSSRSLSVATLEQDELEYRKSLAGAGKQGDVFENTYQMEPSPDKRFSPAKVKRIIENVLREFLEDVEYEPKICRQASKDISDEIVRQVKSLGFDRYKIVCLTNIGQKKDQTVRIGSRCCWDPKVDSYCEAMHASRSLFAATVVYGLYQE